MTRARFRAGIALCALFGSLTAPVFAQGRGGSFGPLDRPLDTSPAATKGGRDLLRPQSNPGIAAPLDIRIQGEGVSLPPGVSGDQPASKPDDVRAPKGNSPEDGKSKPEAKRP